MREQRQGGLGSAGSCRLQEAWGQQSSGCGRRAAEGSPQLPLLSHCRHRRPQHHHIRGQPRAGSWVELTLPPEICARSADTELEMKRDRDGLVGHRQNTPPPHAGEPAPVPQQDATSHAGLCRSWDTAGSSEVFQETHSRVQVFSNRLQMGFPETLPQENSTIRDLRIP